MEFFFGLMDPPLKGNSILIRLKGMESTHGLMAESTKDCGKITKCMVRVFSLGLTVVDTKVNTFLTKNKGEVSSYGLMEDHTRDSGRMESNRVKESI
jgi:hypothetical protein